MAVEIVFSNEMSRDMDPETAVLTFTFTFMHLADAFIQSDLQLHSGYTFSLVYMCSLGFEPTTFRSADAMFYHWATQEHILNILHHT